MNPFVTTGYCGPKYFCDRVKETEDLKKLLLNNNNVALISPRRYGKTDLVKHTLGQKEFKGNYVFILDIYSTKSLQDMVCLMGKKIVDQLKPYGRKALDTFIAYLKSIRGGFSVDAAGAPFWTVQAGEIHSPQTTLDEIFNYLQNAGRRCIVILDEFQQICKYPEKGTEAAIRSLVQSCNNANFVFCGSQMHLMGEMFTSESRPFYQSVTLFNLGLIPEEKYAEFATRKFSEAGKKLESEVCTELYERFRGITFYLQKVMNILFMETPEKGTCSIDMLDKAIEYLVQISAPTYETLLYQLPEMQEKILMAIAIEGPCSGITSSEFVSKYALKSASSVKSAVRGLMEKGLVNQFLGKYEIYDLILGEYIRSSR